MAAQSLVSQAGAGKLTQGTGVFCRRTNLNSDLSPPVQGGLSEQQASEHREQSEGVREKNETLLRFSSHA